MKALLSCLLSICLVLSSMAPAMAQVRIGRPAGRRVHGTQAGRTYHLRTRASSHGEPASHMPAHQTSLPKTEFYGLDETVQRAALQQQNAFRQQTFSLSPEALQQPQVLRADFALSAILTQAPQETLSSAVQFYRKDLARQGQALGDVSLAGRSLSGFLARGTQAVQDQFLEIITSASSLAAVGTKQDAPALIAFCKQASAGPLKEVAQVITARGLLRFGAYEEFNTWVRTQETAGEFWQELAAYVKEENLPVTFTAKPAAPLYKEGLEQWLSQGGQLHQIHSDFSRQATREWVHLGELEQPQEAAQPVAEKAKPTQAQLAAHLAASLENPLQQLPVVEGTTLPKLSQPAAQTATQAVPAAKANVSHAPVLYSGIPVFAFADRISKARQGLRDWRNKKKAKQSEALEEAPGLHDASQIRTVSDNLLDYQLGVAAADETEGLAEKPIVDFAEGGFLLTLEQDGHEQILPVNLTISNRFLNRNWQSFVANHSKTPYNRVVIKPESRLKKGKYVLEMRNQVRKPSTMDHFYFRLQNNHVGLLVSMLQKQGIENFRLKLEASPNTFYKPMDFPVIREGTTEKLPITVSVPSDRFVPGSQLVLMKSGELGWILPGEKKAVAETKMYVRIPKHQITELVEVLKPLPENAPRLNIALRSTQNGAKFISTWVSASNVSLGKTFGPMVEGPLNMSTANADRLMFGINYVLPGLSSLLTPALKKYGEKRIMTISVLLSTAAGVLASTGGFYGFVNGMTLNGVQKGLFLSALVCMSVSSILKQLTTNLLIRANGGEVEYINEDPGHKGKKMASEEKVSPRVLNRRVKEVFEQTFRPKKYAREHGNLAGSEQAQLAHLIRYNLGFIFKNVGTLAFLALPYGINVAGSWFGLDLGLDFSVSFPIYAAYSAVLTWRMMHAKLRDAYSAKNIEQSKNAVFKTLDKLVAEIVNPKDKEKSTENLDILTRALYDDLDSYVLARQKVDAKLKRKEVYTQAKAAALEEFGKRLQAAGVSAERAQALAEKTNLDLGKLENLFKNMKGMFKVEGVAPLLAGMTLATVHEFVVSSSFAGTMNQVISAGDLANFLVAGTLYLPMIVGRIGGNWLSPKISPGSMYMLCSGLSALGTAMIGFSGGDVPTMIAGAAVASLGMGNYYTQMYNYIMEKHQKYRRELSSLLSLTMALGGIGAMFAPGSSALDMVFAGTLLGISWLTTLPMFASSSFVKVWKSSRMGQKTQAHINRVKAHWKKHNTPRGPNLNMDDAAPAN